MAADLELRKILVEMRYAASLRVYTRMDQVAIDLAKNFPHWSRSPLSLEIFDKQSHRHLAIQFSRSSYDCDGPNDVGAELGVARESLKAITQAIGVLKLGRFGMRFGFIAKSVLPFQELAANLHGRFCTPLHRVPAFQGMTLADTSFVVVVDKDDWSYRVAIGPMTRDEWFENIPHNRQVFQEEPESETLQKYRSSFPDRFIFVDIDVYRKDVDVEHVFKLFRARYANADEIARKLVDYCQET